MKPAKDEFRTSTGLMGWTAHFAARCSDDFVPLRTMITLATERICAVVCTSSSFARSFASTSQKLTVKSYCFGVDPVSGTKIVKSQRHAHD